MISVVVPVYNSELSLRELTERIHKTISGLGLLYEIILIDDASKDRSWKQIKKLVNEHPGMIHGYRLKQNTGQQHATFFGLTRAKGEFIVTIDDDLQFPPEEIIKLYQRLIQSDADIVYGTYRQEYFSSVRSVFRVIFIILSFLLFGENKSTSFRIIKRNLADRIISSKNPLRIIDLIIRKLRTDIGRVKINHLNRKHSVSNYTIKSLIRLSIQISAIYSSLMRRILFYAVYCLIVCFVFLLPYIFFINERSGGTSFPSVMGIISFLIALVPVVGFEIFIRKYRQKIIRNHSYNPSIEEQI